MDEIKPSNIFFKFCALISEVSCRLRVIRGKLSTPFQFASNGNEEEVEKLLSSTDEPGSSGEKFCHPLCSCEKCEKLHTRYGPFTTLQLVFNKARSNRRKILAVAKQLKQLRKECLKKNCFSGFLFATA